MFTLHFLKSSWPSGQFSYSGIKAVLGVFKEERAMLKSDLQLSTWLHGSVESQQEMMAAIRKPKYICNSTARLQSVLKSVKHKPVTSLFLFPTAAVHTQMVDAFKMPFGLLHNMKKCCL